MAFKNYFKESVENDIEKLNELYEPLFEANEDSTIHNFTPNGIMQFQKSFTDSAPTVSKATDLVILNPKNEEDKKKISAYKKSKGMVRLIAYIMTKGRFTKPSPDAHFFNVSKEFLTFKGADGLVAKTPEEKDLLKKIKERESTRSKDQTDSSFKITDDESVIFLNILKNTDPTKFTMGVYYILDKDNDLFYEYIYNKKTELFSFDSMFKTAEPYEGETEEGKGFKISGKAQENEDIQVLGLFFDAKELMNQISKFQASHQDLKIPFENKEFRSIVKPFEDALNASDDFKSFNGVIKKSYQKFSYSDWLNICQLANGMTQFRKDVVKISKPYIIFDKIPKFKELEAEKMGYKEDGDYGKVSTTDVIVSNIPGDDVLTYLESPDIKLVPDDQAVSIMKDGKSVGKFWQVSLKISTKYSQLGRSQKYFSKIYGMQVKGKDVYESLNYEQVLSEGILEKLSDTAKKGAKFLKEVGKKFYDKIKYLFLALKEWSGSLRDKLTKEVSTQIVEDARRLYGKALTESVKEDISNMIITLLNNPEKNWEMANEKINILGGDLMKMNSSIVTTKFSTAYKPPKYTENVFKKQIFSYSFMLALKKVLENSKNPLEKYIEELLGLYIEAVFGATQLPLWKVYSTINDHAPYEYVGTKESSKEFRKGNILKNLKNDGLPLVYTLFQPTKGFHTIDMELLSNLIGEDGKFNPYYTHFSVDYNKNNMSPQFIAERENVIPNL